MPFISVSTNAPQPSNLTQSGSGEIIFPLAKLSAVDRSEKNARKKSVLDRIVQSVYANADDIVF